MRGKRLSTGLRAALAIVIVTLLASSAWAATEKVLHNFGLNRTDGVEPGAGLIFDAAGNLYGTAYYGGVYGHGTVFELTPKESGGWTEKTLHNFGLDRTDGMEPAAELIFDAAGNLYGTAHDGGVYGYGTVFELTPKEGGGWTEKTLHNFGLSRTDGMEPSAGLAFDSAGNLYGTTTSGGTYNYGTVFELTPREGGGWTEKTLHNFGNGMDGTNPFAGVILDSAGNLFGSTWGGGTYGYGTVFELTPREGGGWTEKTLHSFGDGKDGHYLLAGLIFDAAGNLYGTAYDGGVYGQGTIFELTLKEGGGWTEKTLHHFGNGNDGTLPNGLILDAVGNLYGTTQYGGVYGSGTVFELIPAGGGGWTEKKLHNFGNGKDGAGPNTSLVWDAAGNLYGTTGLGGNRGEGTVFEITP